MRFDPITGSHLSERTLVAASYYLLIAMAHLAVLPNDKKLLMCSVALGSAAMAMISRFALKNGTPQQTEVWMMVLVGIVTANITLHGVVVGDREQIYYITTLLAAFPMLTPTARTAALSSLILLTGAIILLAFHVPVFTISLAFLLGGPAIGGWFAAVRTRGLADVLASSQAEAQRLREIAEQSEQAKAQFLANMSHEIRTPLNGIIGVLEVLANSKLTIKQRKMIDLIQGSGQTLERLLTDILDISKIEAGKLYVEREPFDLAREIEAAANLLHARAKDKDLSFTVVIEPDARGAYLGDAVRLRQVVTNLVSNAVKFTEHGGVNIKVTRDDLEDTTRVKITVEDTGPGLDSRTLGRLFQRFEQADGSITRLHGGTGLGLSIVKSLVQMQGGTVSVRSEPGRGSQFEVIIPYAIAGPEQIVARSSADANFREAGTVPLNILLAEDNISNRQVVSLILESFGVNLTIAEDGRQAVAAFRAKVFDLVLMDMQMPVMDGLEATRSIRAFELAQGRPRLPIVAMTANAMDSDRQA
ncbi:MAG: hypothetical protein CGW95_12965, partial [Phenylobacterium zucineum]